jgi:hypothetical protein
MKYVMRLTDERVSKEKTKHESKSTTEQIYWGYTPPPIAPLQLKSRQHLKEQIQQQVDDAGMQEHGRNNTPSMERYDQAHFAK